MKKIVKPLKYHGGSAYYLKDLLPLVPKHIHRVETHGGGLSYTLASDPEGVSEVVNDVNGALMNFWRVLQDTHTFQEFKRLAETTPFSIVEWKESTFNNELSPASIDQDVYDAWKFFICCRQSMAGRLKSFTPVTRNRTRRGMNNEVSAWLSAIEGLLEVHNRLKRILILCEDGEKVIKQQDGPNTFFFVDPSWLPETRSCPNVYEYEMTPEQHQSLLDTLGGVQGKFMLLGYFSTMYDEAAKKYNWGRIDLTTPNHSAKSEKKEIRRVCCWINYSITG